MLSGDKGDPAPPEFLDRYKGDKGTAGKPGIPGLEGIPGGPGICKLFKICCFAIFLSNLMFFKLSVVLMLHLIL